MLSNVIQSYIDKLPLDFTQRKRVKAAAPQSIADIHALLATSGVMPGAAGAAPQSDATEVYDPAYQSVAARLHLAYGMPPESSPPPVAPTPDTVASSVPEISVDQQGRSAIRIAPPLQRTPIMARPWGTLNPLKRWIEKANREFDKRRGVDGNLREMAPPLSGAEPNYVRKMGAHKNLAGLRQPDASALPPDASNHHDAVVDAPDPSGDRESRGIARRLVLLILMLAQTAVATYFMSAVLPYHGTHTMEMVSLSLFALLFCWVSAGFWTAMAGFLVLMRGTDRYIISREEALPGPIPQGARTAIVIPICNEDVQRVFAGLRATYESVAKTGDLKQFDFFILSDSGDSDIIAAELDAWSDLCRTIGGFGRIFYRHRRRRVKRKSGNIDDFCRRWGAAYSYMIVLDADSVMSGTCLSTLVRLMEANPGAGIIQTAPRAAGRDTLYARIQQFSTRVYGPLFTAGLHYWQLGESHYWGHNAIIRLAPFMAHCALAPLPGKGALAGDILSHDFVEAALMRRAGWGVWIAYDLGGSYEEMPPNLLDELKRDRRWCQGNLMNFRLFLAHGMHAVHRAVFVTGVMAYLSAPLWFIYLMLSTTLLAMHALIPPEYFSTPGQLFPAWPEWHPERALTLFTATATLLFLPKILSVVLIIVKGAREFGGGVKLTLSMIMELLFSMCLAPVRMLFHTHFVTAAFLGWAIVWKSPPREDTATPWSEAIHRHGAHTVLGVIWGAFVYYIEPAFIWWLLPIVGSLVLSIPISVYSSRVSLGRSMRRANFFVIPEEVDLPVELAATTRYNEQEIYLADFIDAVVDPVTNALVCGSHIARPNVPEHSRAMRRQMVADALRRGPDALTGKQKNLLMEDPLMLSRLHFDVWTSPDANKRWHMPMKVGSATV